jgi:5'-nucleotidase
VLRRGNAITVTPFALQQTHRGALERLGNICLKGR